MRLRNFYFLARTLTRHRQLFVKSSCFAPHTAMSACHKAARPFARYLQQSQASSHNSQSVRSFTTSRISRSEAAFLEASSTTPKIDPLTVISPRGERALLSSGISPIGSRRRRAALRSSDNVPFEQLPYQCFQEARKILQADREEKLQAIEKERTRIAWLSAQDASTISGGEKQKQTRLHSMQRYLERLKILADINDPLVKKRFEDGEGMRDFLLHLNT
jgi:large subunit ribosomal protein L35